MKFLVDAQLPARLAELLNLIGHDAVHVSALPDGNRTPDAHIARIADEDDRTVITKDRDFRDSHLLSGSPRSLLTVATGNITNNRLLALFTENIDAIAALLIRARHVEISNLGLITHPTTGNG